MYYLLISSTLSPSTRTHWSGVLKNTRKIVNRYYTSMTNITYKWFRFSASFKVYRVYYFCTRRFNFIITTIYPTTRKSPCIFVSALIAVNTTCVPLFTATKLLWAQDETFTTKGRWYYGWARCSKLRVFGVFALHLDTADENVSRLRSKTNYISGKRLHRYIGVRV